MRMITKTTTAVKAATLSAAILAAFFGCASTAATAPKIPVQLGEADSGPTALMRASYRRGDFATVEKQFAELNADSVPDSTKYSARYLMGLTLMLRGGYHEARQLLTTIPDNHPDYLFARHAAAVASLMIADDDNGHKDAADDLTSVVNAKPQNRAQEEIINRSYVLLGVILYEAQKPDNVTWMVRMVDKNSRHYTDALLVHGWAALHQRDWGKCLSIGKELANTATDPFLRAEGKILQAYSLVMHKDYDRAVYQLECAIAMMRSNIGAHEPDTAVERNEYEYDGELFGKLSFINTLNFDMRMEDLEYNLKLLRKIARPHRKADTIDVEVEKFGTEEFRTDVEIERLKKMIEEEECRK